MSTINRSARNHRWLWRLLATLMALALIPGMTAVTPAVAAVNVTFTDANLEAKVRSTLGIAVGPISSTQMEALTELDASSASVTNLVGLEYATNLTTLNAGGNGTLASLDPLADLASLRYLDVSWTAVSSLTPLANLTGLVTLGIYGDAGITDLSPLTNLTQLRTLSAGQIRATDLTPLAGMTAMQTLDLGYNAVDNLEPLAGMVDLISLNLYSTGTISDLRPLSGMTNMGWINLSRAEIYDLTGLGNLNANTGGLVIIAYNWLDLTPGSASVQVLDTLTARGYTVLSDPQKSGGSITGVVTDSAGTPISGARVSLTDGPSTVTGADGVYVIGLAKPGSRSISFSKANYASDSVTVSVTLGNTATAHGTLAPDPGRISGRVTTPSGTGLAGVAVSVDGGPAVLSSAGGDYTVPAPAGAHTVNFAKDYYLSASSSVTVAPGGGATANVQLTPATISLSITRSPSKSTLTYKRKKGKASFTLSATLRDARGAVASAWVWVQKSSNGRTWKNAYQVRTDAAGKVSKRITLKKRQTIYYRWSAAATAVNTAAATSKQKVKIR